MVHAHLPARQVTFVAHVAPGGIAQVPQVPPQPSLPHSLSLHLVDTHLPAEQVSPHAHEQSLGQVVQSSPRAGEQAPSPHLQPGRLGHAVHASSQQESSAKQASSQSQVPVEPPQWPTQESVLPSGTQAPAAQVSPAGQVPQLPPHPSSPHFLPVQSGVHGPVLQSPCWQE